MDVPRIGSEFAGYRLESLVGRGGMSIVYGAENIRLGKKVALKILAPELAENDMFRERFVRESRAVASMNHPNIITIFDAGEAQELLFIAMQYVEGSDLKALLARGGALPIARAISIIGQVAGALDAAHARGLLHRDVKPANVLRDNTTWPDEADHVYLSDFGLTKHNTSHSGLTATGQFIGTLDYCSPEQIEGAAVDARTDVYSLGCMAYECLTGEVPFRKESDIALMWAHVREDPRPIIQIRPEIPAEAAGVVTKAMAKSPDDRYVSCRQFAAELRASLQRPAPAAAGISQGVAAPTGQATILEGPPKAPAREWTAPASAGSAGPVTVTERMAPDLLSEPPPAATPGPDALRPGTPVGPSSGPAPPRARRRGFAIAVVLAIVGWATAAGMAFVAVSRSQGKPAPQPSGQQMDTNQRNLLEHIPSAVSVTGCHEKVERPDVMASSFASVACDPGSITFVQYNSIHDQVGINEHWDEARMEHKLDPSEGDCATGPLGEGRWWSIGTSGRVTHKLGRPTETQTTGGRVMCYTAGDDVVIEWYDSDTHIYAWARAPAGNYRELLDWWTEQAGPDHPVHTGGDMGGM